MAGRAARGGAVDRTVRLDNLVFHYRDWGDPAAPPLLLLHGMSWHARGWDTIAAALCDRFLVLALDQRGHGESGHAPDYAWQRWVGDIKAFTEALALRNFSLIGHSFGGVIAYMFATRYPQTVARLVIVDIGPPPAVSSAPPPRGSLASVPDTFPDPEAYIGYLRRLDPHAREEELRHGALHNLVQQEDGRWLLRWDAALRAPDFPFPLPDIPAQWAALRALSCPTLLVKGGQSTFPREHAEAMVRAIPDARLAEIPAAGHTVHWADPPAFLAVVRPFLLHEPP